MESRFAGLSRIIRAQGVVDWVADKLASPTEDNLLKLAKFAYMTGLINKADLKRHLAVDAAGARALVAQWYKDHREKGCGIC